MPARPRRRGPTLVRPDRGDLAVIGLYTGRIVTAVGLVMLAPAALGVARGEHHDALGLIIGAAGAVLVGQVAEWRLRTRRGLDWSRAMAVVALGWLAAAFVGAVPLHLSGHYPTFVDAYFDAMSGFATAGLSVISDLDHVSDSLNLWRHLMQFLGGQGVVLVALTFFTGGGGLTGLYAGEGREERILPNVVHSAQFIWRVALTYAAVGVAALWAALGHAGMPPLHGLLHAVNLFMAAFDTGGFAPTSASVGFYHSVAVEAVLAVLMVAGALSFGLHHRLWRTREGGRELASNLETRVLLLSVLGLFALAALGLTRFGVYDSGEELFRRGFFQLLSAHTGTGFTTIPGRLLATGWGPVAPAILVTAMALGGMAGSTTGGIKALRVGLLAKSVAYDVRRVLLPPDAVVVQSYHFHGGRQILEARAVRTAVVVMLLYVALYLVGGAVGVLYGYPVQEALFESVSAGAAVGLSAGITQPGLETGLKLVYVVQMWLGRLEFIAVFALAGYCYALLRGRP